MTPLRLRRRHIPLLVAVDLWLLFGVAVFGWLSIAQPPSAVPQSSVAPLVAAINQGQVNAIELWHYPNDTERNTAYFFLSNGETWSIAVDYTATEAGLRDRLQTEGADLSDDFVSDHITLHTQTDLAEALPLMVGGLLMVAALTTIGAVWLLLRSAGVGG